MVKQGTIIIVSFDPALGHEQKKTRPALVVSSNEFNSRCNMTWLCPISHADDFPLHINLPQGLKTDGKILCDQIKSMDLSARHYRVVETVPDDYLQKIRNVLKLCI